MILVDSSVLISFLRGDSTPCTKYLLYLDSENVEYGIPAICIQEVLQGARDAQEWKLLSRYLKTQVIVNPSNLTELHIKAARCYFDCKRRGISVRSAADCFIAALCVEQKARLLHEDRDFVQIAKVIPLKFPRSL